MADLSAVLRKTIDGLPRATPQLRAKVYDKARAAIQRQIEAADPPLAEDLVAARQSALNDAIERTEAHYLSMDAAGEDSSPPAPAAQPPSASDRRDGASAAVGTPAPAGSLSRPDRDGRAQKEFRSATASGGHGGEDLALRPLKPSRDSDAPIFPSKVEEPEGAARPAALGAPFVVPTAESGDGGADANGDNAADGLLAPDDIPEADLAAPRYPAQRRSAKRGSARPLAAGIAAVVLLGGAGALGWTYRDQIEALLVGPAGGLVASVEEPSVASPAETASESEGEDAAAGETEVAALPQADDDVPAAGAPAAAASTRQFTQRLLPDGTEVDEGPGASNTNAFDEGTNIATASPVADEEEPESETLESAIGQEPVTVGEVPAAGAGAEAASEVAALEPDAGPGAPAVAQKAVFYEERSETEAGTQQSGNVVWSVVNEPPSEGQPAEPAIRAVADVPEENLKLTMTIRRNADPTLPASHVIELLFDTPANFDGGSVANVQRLALKPTEQARGEPLIGVAGKISDGFFIIALNNLEQAIQSNLALMGEEEWIDIPLAYATGRRALMSIEKGIPGDRVFREAMDAWAAKT